MLVYAFCLLLTVCSDVWEYSLTFFVFISFFRIFFVFLFWHWHSELYFVTHFIHSIIKSYEYYRKIILILKFHVRQSQYVLQIVQCKNLRFCKSWRTNYSEFFSNEISSISHSIGICRRRLGNIHIRSLWFTFSKSSFSVCQGFTGYML